MGATGQCTHPLGRLSTRWRLSACLLFLYLSTIECLNDNSSSSSPSTSPSPIFSSTTTTRHCDRCRSGEPLWSSVSRPPSGDCVSGHYYAIASSVHCDCDFVCARESRQACRLSLPNIDPHIARQTLCDTSLSLLCNEKTALCEGPLLLSVTHIRHQSFYVNWISDTPLANGTSARIYLAPYASANVKEANFAPIKAYITRTEANRHSAKVDSLGDNSAYIVKVVDGGKEELVIVKTTENTLIEVLPKVLVTQRNASSLSIAFDDFKPSVNYNLGYAIKYRPLPGDGTLPPSSPSTVNDSTWTIVSSNSSRPFYLLSHLLPSTQYQIQVFTWTDERASVRSSSEVINASTLDGCHYEKVTYAVGESVVSDCDQTCTCQSGGSLACTDRCSPPYVSLKTATINRTLSCTPHLTDQCCVQCKGTPTPTTTTTTTPATSSKKFIDKPGECPKATTSRNETTCGSSSSSTVGKSSVAGECTHDYHCTGIKKCCPSVCATLPLTCMAPANSSVALTSRQCSFTCGPNATCVFSEEESSHRCVCLEGFTSEEPMDGCHPLPVKGSARQHECTFQAKQYIIGQSFEHNCKMCTCSEALEVECVPKCANHSTTPLTPGCKLLADPADPACCQKVVCDPAATVSSPEKHHNESSHLLEAGCAHHGLTYAVNESFVMDCELRCLCKGNGQVDCTPRCFADPGYDERFCYLVDDPDDPECCKISICEHKEHEEDVPSLPLPVPALLPPKGLIIELAEAINSTALKLRVVNSSAASGIIFYSVLHPNTTLNMTEEAWNQTTVTSGDYTRVANNSVELLLGGLTSQTDYLIYLKEGEQQSNSVYVRTFPPGINHTFNGCFHGSEIIDVGGLFYEGDCEYRCICREGGFRECEDRCPTYIDMILDESRCAWVQSTEDSCCTVPLCRQEHQEASLGQCSSTDGKQYDIGDIWTVGRECQQKRCQCVLSGVGSNATLEIKCTGGCPVIPPSALEPNEHCRSPKVIQPENNCVCPYVVCDKNINPLDLPEKGLSPEGNPLYCEFKGDKIAIGKEFYDNCRAICRCETSVTGGVLNCTPITCSRAFGPLTTKCLEWDIDAQFLPVAPNCCPEPRCKNDGSCAFHGIRFNNQHDLPMELLPCGKKCKCNNGQIQCRDLCPKVPEEPPPGMPCPLSNAFRGHLPGDSCCIHWQCRDSFEDVIKGSCMYQGKRFKLGEHWDETETGISRRCSCKNTHGIMHVSCSPGNCQQMTDRFLQPTPDCLMPTVIVPKDPIVCPYVVCNQTKADGEELESVDIVAINATSARIRFTLPPLYVGLLGHAEVHYTTDMNIPRHQWNIQKFARPKRMFDIPNIEYHLGNLKADTTYFLQIEVVIEALKTGPTSEIYKLYQPPLPVVSSTTPSTTTTTTLPPIIMLDMHLAGTPLTPTSIKLTWRPFTPKEGRFIDGVQIRYKKADIEGEEWSYSPMLHRATVQYVLDELDPGLTYAVDLLFASVEGLSTNIVSTKPVVVDLPSPPKDDYAFEVHIYPDDVAINDGQIDIEVRNLPQPVGKYVNVAKLLYENEATAQVRFDYITIDERAKFSFSNLLPNTRYKVWIELYLKNGQIVSSNSIDIITKYTKSRSFEENDLGALTGSHLVESKYLFTFMIISVFVFIAGAAFFVVTCFFLRKNSTAAISRVCISEAAYDNPTYKTFEAADKCSMEDSLSKSSTIPAK